MERLLAIALGAEVPPPEPALGRLRDIAESAVGPTLSRNGSRSAASMRACRAGRALKQERSRKEKVNKNIQVQILHHNRNTALRPDDLMVIPGEKRAKISGSGRWQQVLPGTFLAVAFSHPATSDTALSERYDIGNGAPADIRAAAAMLLYRMQSEHVAEVMSPPVPAKQPSFIIFQFMWDIASFKVKVSSGLANTHPVMGAHGMLTFCIGDRIHNEEITIPPTAVWDESANSMLAVLKRHVPWALPLPENGGLSEPGRCFVGLTPGCDSARPNMKLLKFLGTISSNYLLPGKCRNHSIGLCLEPISVFLGLLCPAFCTIKRLHSATYHTRFLQKLHEVIDAKMAFMTPEEDPWYRPFPDDRQYAAALLEMTYYKRDLHRAYIDDDTKQQLEEEDKVRRAAGQRLMNALVGDWRSKTIVFWAHGEYRGVTREQAVLIVMELYLEVNPHIIPVPASNKWLSVLPAVADLCRGCNIHHLTSETILCMAGKSPLKPDHDSDDEDERANLGMQMETNEFHKMNQKRQTKIVAWMSEPLTRAFLLLWLAICLKVLHLHYLLFRDAKAGLGSDSREQGAVPTVGVSSKHVVFDLCNPMRSRARKVLHELTEMLKAGLQEHLHHWELFYKLFGQAWPESFMRKARSALLIVVGNVWRRLVVEFEVYPWRLATVVDPAESMARREQCVKEFYEANDCCLDSGFSRTLRATVPQENFFREDVQAFVFWMFARAVFSTAFVECLFASYKQWVSKTTNPIRIGQLAAKHMTHSFMRVLRKLQDKAVDDLGVRPRRRRGAVRKRTTRTTKRTTYRSSTSTKRCRPVWIHSKIAKTARATTNMQVFVGTHIRKTAASGLSMAERLAQAHRAWREADVFQKTLADRQAQDKRRRPALQVDRVNAEFDRLRAAVPCDVATPWGVGTEQYPLTHSDVAVAYQTKSFLTSTGREWYSQHGAQPLPDPSIPETVEARKCCSSSRPFCKQDTDQDTEARLQRILKELRVIFAPRGRPVVYGRLAMLCHENHIFYVECISARKTPFEGEFVLHAGPQQPPDPPVTISMSFRNEYQRFLPDLVDEGSLAAKMARAGSEWSYTFLEANPATMNSTGFERLEVFATQTVDVQEQIQVERAHLESRCAIKALRRQQAKCGQARGRQGRGGSRGRSGGARGRGRGGSRGRSMAAGAAAVLFPDDIIESDSEEFSEADADGVAELQEDWADAAAAAAATDASRVRAAAAQSSGPSASSSGAASSGATASSSSSSAPTASAPMFAAGADSFDVPLREEKGGYIFRGARRLGRVAVQSFFSGRGSAQVACFGGHGKCAVWVTLSKVPDVQKLQTWIGRQHFHTNAATHMGEFNLIVYGDPAGPQGNGRPGG